MVEIECLACGKPLKIPQYIDTEKYDGEMVCQECKALLHVKLVKGKVQEYEYVKNFVPRSTSKKLEELLSKLRGYSGKA